VVRQAVQNFSKPEEIPFAWLVKGILDDNSEEPDGK